MKRLEMLQGLAVAPLLAGAAVLTAPAASPASQPSPPSRPKRPETVVRYQIVHPGDPRRGVLPWHHAMGAPCGVCAGTGIPGFMWLGP